MNMIDGANLIKLYDRYHDLINIYTFDSGFIDIYIPKYGTEISFNKKDMQKVTDDIINILHVLHANSPDRYDTIQLKSDYCKSNWVRLCALKTILEEFLLPQKVIDYKKLDTNMLKDKSIYELEEILKHLKEK